MHMTTEYITHAVPTRSGGVEAGSGRTLVVHITPQFRAISAGMHQQDGVLVVGEWQGINPGALR